MAEKIVGCKNCRRVVYSNHVDKNGLCVFCEPKKEESSKEETKDVSSVTGDKK